MKGQTGIAVVSLSQHLPLHTDFERTTVTSSTAGEHEEKKEILLSDLDQNHPSSSLHSLTSNTGTAANAFTLRVLCAQKEKVKKK